MQTPFSHVHSSNKCNCITLPVCSFRSERPFSLSGLLRAYPFDVPEAGKLQPNSENNKQNRCAVQGPVCVVPLYLLQLRDKTAKKHQIPLFYSTRIRVGHCSDKLHLAGQLYSVLSCRFMLPTTIRGGEPSWQKTYCAQLILAPTGLKRTNATPSPSSLLTTAPSSLHNLKKQIAKPLKANNE